MSQVETFLAELRQIVGPHSYAPFAVRILTAIDTASIRETTLAVGAAIRDPMLRSKSLRAAIRNWYSRVMAAREVALAEREAA
jgi:hypothetical protein